MIEHEAWDQFSALRIKHPKSSRLCLMLHGYGANASDLFPLHQYIDFGGHTDWIFPEAPLSLDSLWSRAWFPIDMLELQRCMSEGGHRDFSKNRPEGFDSAIDALESSLAKSISQYEQIIIGGFSQGAMLATYLALRNPDIHYLVAFSSNLIDKFETESLARSRSTKLNFFQSHGTEDPILSFESAKELFELLTSNGHQGEFCPFQGGHQIPALCFERLNAEFRKGI